MQKIRYRKNACSGIKRIGMGSESGQERAVAGFSGAADPGRGLNQGDDRVYPEPGEYVAFSVGPADDNRIDSGVLAEPEMLARDKHRAVVVTLVVEHFAGDPEVPGECVDAGTDAEVVGRGSGEVDLEPVVAGAALILVELVVVGRAVVPGPEDVDKAVVVVVGPERVVEPLVDPESDRVGDVGEPAVAVVAKEPGVGSGGAVQVDVHEVDVTVVVEVRTARAGPDLGVAQAGTREAAGEVPVGRAVGDPEVAGRVTRVA